METEWKGALTRAQAIRIFHLSELDELTLIELCDQFKADVLAKAKQDKGSAV